MQKTHQKIVLYIIFSIGIVASVRFLSAGLKDQAVYASPTIKGVQPNEHVVLPPLPEPPSSSIDSLQIKRNDKPVSRITVGLGASLGAAADAAAIWMEKETGVFLESLISTIGNWITDLWNSYS